jgi:beta-N-acetylhexosaminidase
LLRESMGYRGLVMTDDLEMGAIANRYGSAEASRQAVRAGEEILLICHNPACAEIARDALAELPEKEWRPAVERVAAFSTRLKEPAERFEDGKWKQTNREIGEFRKKVTGVG